MYGRTTYPCNAMTNVTIPFLSQTTCAPPSRNAKTSVGYCPPVRVARAALSESDRIATIGAGCMATVTQIAAGSCDQSGSSTGPQTTQVPIVAGCPPPYVPVGTVPASVSMRIQRDQVLAAENNPLQSGNAVFAVLSTGAYSVLPTDSLCVERFQAFREYLFADSSLYGDSWSRKLNWDP